MVDLALPLEEVVSREIIRKLSLATEAENKEDREIVCEEVFCDITGKLDEAARERLGANEDASFYQVLAPYYLQDTNAGDALLYFCKRLWGQSIVGAIFALLLHRWLLLRPEAGGLEQRQKHVHVLMLGCRQLFLGDVQSASRRFHPLFSFLAHGIALSPNRGPLDGLPAPARVEVLKVAAAYLPYYEDAESVRQLLDDFPSAAHTLSEGGHTPGEGTDFVVAEITDTIPRVKSERGLLSYLRALIALGPALRERGLGVTTRLRLQSELYSLASRGPPHYAPREVRMAARGVLDALFPMGRRSRQLVRLAFWLLNPLSGLLLLPVRVNTYIVGLVGGWLAWALRLADSMLRRRPAQAAATQQRRR